MAKNRGKSKFVVGSSSERENVPSGRLPKTSRVRPSERPVERRSTGWDASKDDVVGGSSVSERATSGKKAGSSGVRRSYPEFPVHWTEADPQGKYAPILHETTKIDGPLEKSVSGDWLVEAKLGHYHRRAEELYGIQHALGYWCELPDQERPRVTHPPRGFISVYTHHLENGLRFPLDPFISELLVSYNISLAQLTPKSMRHIIGFRWVCDFINFPCSVAVFRDLHDLSFNHASKGDGYGWWTIINKRSRRKGEPNYITAYPYLSSDHNWKTEWLFVRVPTDPKHPHFYRPPKWFVTPDPDMRSVAAPDRNHHHYVDLLQWFLAREDNYKLPSNWLPNLNYILREDILAVAGLSRIFDREYGFSCVDPVVLGISLDLKTIHDSAPDYKFGKENPRNPRLKDYVLSPSGVARISEVRADPWDSASSPEAVPVKVVLPDLRTTSDPDQRKRKSSTLLRPSAHPKKAKADQSSEKEVVSEVMPPPKNLLHFMPLPGQKLKSVVVVEPPPVDQPLAEEDTIPSPLKPSAALGIEIQDITKVMEAIEADLVPGSDVPIVAEQKEEAADVSLEREKSPDKEMVDLTEAHVEVPEAEKEEPEQGLTRKRRHSTLGSTSTSALDRLIHADPCSDVPLKRIPEEVREAMARYARAPVLGENPMAHVGSLVGPEAARENLLRANPQWRVPGAEERNPAMMAQYYLNEAVFWSSFASECSSVEERQLRRYQEAYARDIPVLDQKAGQLMAEMVDLKQLYLQYSREAREAAEQIGAEVGRLTFQVEEDAEKIASFDRERREMAAKFASELEEKDSLLKEMTSKFEAAIKQSQEAEARLQQFIKHREIVQNQADKVPVLQLKIREKDAAIRKLEQERVDLYTADQCREQYWNGILGARRMFAKHMPHFPWNEKVPLWMRAQDHLVECQADRDEAEAERQAALAEARAQKAASEGDTTAGGSSKDAPLGDAPETPKS
ncbi:uncharacterized protein [Spinacia oleracea]|uniref:Uncharacterized protein isoform X2 n=1 Tax=Spinacia oleracea TaxID=3562 RepID=A0ABM3RBW7_SPIOL|nr:uncharacterized protein LOC130467959 isoform X2 [Spinacia oleracea]XP_056696522.1 uncharacterized protein LOC130470421 isoform X2 [Spinacia oleracea]XP_056696913.1 uncharacterized protein LOC130470572 isoform X2 [Spinacia oleracea]